MNKNDIMDTVQITGQGAAGAGMVELVHTIPTGNNTIEIVKIIMQGLITLVTVFGIGKKMRPRKPKEPKN